VSVPRVCWVQQNHLSFRTIDRNSSGYLG
jgi:hypothetical protein